MIKSANRLIRGGVKMKKNLLKKVVALGLSFYTPMGLADSGFALRNNRDSRMLNSRGLPNFIEYRFKDCNVSYIVGGLNREKLNENDFTYKSLGETKITKSPNGSIRVFNPCCNLRVVFVVAAFYALGYDEAEILDFIVNLGNDFYSKNIFESIMDEVLKNVEHENIDIAMDMILFSRG